MLTIVTLHYSHRHGDEITVHLSDDAALNAIHDLVLDSWVQVPCGGLACAVPDCAGIPAHPEAVDRDTLIRSYFTHNDDESWHIESHEVPITILISQEQASEWAGEDLTADDMVRLGDCIPNSSVPGTVGTIVSSWRTSNDKADSVADYCDECDAEIPVIEGGSLENEYHLTSCSLYLSASEALVQTGTDQQRGITVQ